MVFKRLLGALGVGGPTVDTVLSTPAVCPGGSVHGRVDLVGGERDAEINGITLCLAARVEVEYEDGEGLTTREFAPVRVCGPLRLAAGERRSVPFAFPVPWETPLTAIGGHHLSGMALGVRTDVDIAGQLDRGDTDPLAVEPLPVQQRVLEAMSALGFHFHRADLEAGRIHGTGQTLPFYQEIEYKAAPQFAGRCNEVELSFVTDPHRVEVVLEFDKRGVFHGGDSVRTFVLDHGAGRHDLTGTVDGWIRGALGH
ncbi:sporulation protein [Kitasatospora phosalacinea]|uniref:sporulation protein n=1 Tax=Kitasatospora phosalacinea TaxID=2065 RepID=UPI0005249491|nr:sporulation protein [Kitasatospora phosalacinea]